ncbi:MAG: hypothetical protein D6711_06850 [Chloroflexi bacterium]|nr:MAG: hypothetical protein D6711_06850 [Chloroflexota bacterium]
MTFQFRKLTLKNWLVYGDRETVIDFTQFNSGRNLVVFHGQNGFGKTSLLRALWFLFSDDYKDDALVEMWNEKERASGEGELEVALEFLYRDKVWVLSKGAYFELRGSRIAVNPFTKLWIDGCEIRDQIDDQISRVIPKECLQFVFFDGAEITRYAQTQYEDGVKEAIELMLGIPAVRNLRHDLGRIISELQEEQQEILLAEQQNNELAAEVERLEEMKVSYEERLKDLTKKQDSIQAAQEKLEKEAAQLEAIQAEQEALREKQSRRANLEERRDELDAQIDDLIQSAPVRMLMRPLEHVIEEAIAQQEASSRLEKYRLRKKLIEELLEEADCICGRPIDEHIDTHFGNEIKRLDSIIDSQNANPNSINQRDLISLQSIVDQLANNPVDGKELYDRRALYIQQIEEIDTDIERLRDRLGDNESIQVQELLEQQRVTAEQLQNVKHEIGVVEKNLEETQKKLKEKRREVDQTTGTTDRGKGIARTLEVTRGLLAASEQFVERLVDRKRRAIEDITSNIFKKITNKPQEYAGVRVRDDYTLEVYRHDSSTVDNSQLSAGEREVLAYSFITALNLSSPTPAPFVMDTPFGHLDSVHRDRLLKSLPMLKVQVLLLATDRDLPPAERGMIIPYIADEFEIKRDQFNKVSYIKEAE